MPQRKNLVPFTGDQSREEAVKNGRKGGIASGKARRQKANLKRTLETLLKLDLPESDLKRQLEAMGVDPSLEQGLAFSVLIRAIQDGNFQSLKILSDMLGQSQSPADKKEQRARTKRLEVETQRLEEEIERKSGREGSDQSNKQITAIADLINTPRAERVLQDFMTPIVEDKPEETESEGTE